MAKILDIGEGTLTIRVGFGIKFPYAADSEEAEARRVELSDKLNEYALSEGIKALEDQLIEKAAEAMGFTPEGITEAIEKRESGRKANRLEEEKGRKERHDKRVRAGR